MGVLALTSASFSSATADFTFTDGAASGVLSDREAAQLVAALARADDPDDVARDVPWAAAVRRPDGSVAVTASTMFIGGLFYAVGDGLLGVGSDPVSCACRTGIPVRPDAGMLRRFAVADAGPDESPVAGVRRLVPGTTLIWNPDGTRRLVDWGGPDRLPEPQFYDQAEVIEEYLRLFDAVTAGLASRTPSIVATVSGGLDSTFMAASLVRTAPAGQIVQGYCHDPLEQAQVTSRGKFDPDDLVRARLLGQRYPDRLRIHALRNTGLVHPLDAAAIGYRRSGWPSLAPANAVWLDEFAEHAKRAGATLRFHAGQGNSAYSYDHRYAARYYAARADARRLSKLVTGRPAGTSLGSAVRARLWLPLTRPYPSGPAATFPFTADQVRQRVVPDRQWYLGWLAGRRGPFNAALNAGGSAPAHVADPFAARSIIELAAAIHPHVWQQGHPTRALARELGRDRVPDEIRLRRRRGGQGMDAWYVVRAAPDRMEVGLRTLQDCSEMAEWVDAGAVRRWWDEASKSSTPDTARLSQALRLIALAEYVRWLTTV